MKRDMDLIRAILMHINEKDDDRPLTDQNFDGHSELTIAEHCHLLYEAGLVRCETITSSSTPERIIKVFPFGLTWAGHDFVESIKNEVIWAKAKNSVLSKLSGLPFDLLKAALVESCKEAVSGS